MPLKIAQRKLPRRAVVARRRLDSLARAFGEASGKKGLVSPLLSNESLRDVDQVAL
jgi:hypothetical protein